MLITNQTLFETFAGFVSYHTPGSISLLKLQSTFSVKLKPTSRWVWEFSYQFREFLEIEIWELGDLKVTLDVSSEVKDGRRSRSVGFNIIDASLY